MFERLTDVVAGLAGRRDESRDFESFISSYQLLLQLLTGFLFTTNWGDKTAVELFFGGLANPGHCVEASA